jgi:UDP-GlcNAc:undecaprenyl-phosphate/decaprenyl-phosphate GlcNAc-1-phosphate transferase
MMFLQAAGSFAVCVLAILALRPLAIAVDLIDRPGGRKTHHGNVPIVGGLAMFMGLVLGIGLLPGEGSTAGLYLAACAILVTVGLVDDRFGLSPWARLPGQIAAAVVLIAGCGARVTTLGDPFGTGLVNLSGYASFGFTLIIVVAAVNAFNILDGLDGLAGSVALTSLAAIAYLSWRAGHLIPLAVSLVLGAVICAFLIFNVPVRHNRALRCFMGDAGSTLLGFSVAWLCIGITQGPGKAVSPVTALWIVALPLYELFWTTIRRIIRGVSPFKADANHFHHLLLRAGFGVRGAFGVFVSLTVLFSGIGLLTERFGLPDHYSFLLLIAAGVGTVFLMYRASVLWQVIPESLRRLPPLEPAVMLQSPAGGDRAQA